MASKLKWINTSSTPRPCFKAKTPKGTWMLRPTVVSNSDAWDLFHSTNHFQFSHVIEAVNEEAARKVAQFTEGHIKPPSEIEFD